VIGIDQHSSDFDGTPALQARRRWTGNGPAAGAGGMRADGEAAIAAPRAERSNEKPT